MDLKEYNEKRDFENTPEPKGQFSPSTGDLIFVVQKHAASKLHYDFRLEADGVLKSWAIPKGPSLSPKDKRLAMRVEDHPLSYAYFEGTIPDGNYGAGQVIVWDRGYYHIPGTRDSKESEKSILEGLEKGRIEFVLEGEKLKGEFSLVKMHLENKETWLLIKKKDKYSTEEDITQKTRSVISEKEISNKEISNVENIKTDVLDKPEPQKRKKTNTETASGSTSTKKLVLNNLSKIYFPEDKITKGDIINYYKKIGHYILPYLKNRPHTLLRHPNGISEEGFFQKDLKENSPDWIKTIEIQSESNKRTIKYIVCTNQASLLYMVNLGCIEINPWLSKVDRLNLPDYMVIDLDPLEAEFNMVVETALTVKEILDESNIKSFCKTSGATGLHIYVPLSGKYEFETSKSFAHMIVRLVHNKIPDITSLERNPSKRSGKVYLDYLQNRSGQTIAAPYSVRPKPGATVSAPLNWDEVKPGLDPMKF
ncbi:MAG: non-homologous end-joining DNA ligase, partial [Bacteroidota bacterium]|nr:non-homologous end-joining DNA ligase [Bacteroidota bacterium]